MKQAKTEQASSASVKFKEFRSRYTSQHNMGPAGYTVKLEQWEEEDRQLAAAGIPNPYDAYPDDRSKNWIRARSKLVIKDRVAVIVFNNKEAEKLSADIKEKIACAESSGMAGQREYNVLSQCLGRLNNTVVCVVSPATRAGSMHGLSTSRCTGRRRGRRPTHQLIRKR
jgi:hypothetical protein